MRQMILNLFSSWQIECEIYSPTKDDCMTTRACMDSKIDLLGMDYEGSSNYDAICHLSLLKYTWYVLQIAYQREM